MKNTFYFAATEYFATGEGMTHSLLITYAHPLPDRDYEDRPDYDLDTNIYNPGVLKHTYEEIVILQFAELLNHGSTRGVKTYTQDEFLIKYSGMIPEFVIRRLNPDATVPANFVWYTKFHVNFS